ncbi:MAG: CHRD domain-containing protein, partial [Acidimicrobiales bacterium]
ADNGNDRGEGGRPFRLALSGAQEVAPVNPDGAADHGSVTLRLNQGAGRVCWRFGPLALKPGEALPTAGHIHRGAVGVAGPVVVGLFTTAATAPTAYPTTPSCVNADPALVKEIRKHPAAFYVNLHNATHPSGVVRGQLHK